MEDLVLFQQQIEQNQVVHSVIDLILTQVDEQVYHSAIQTQVLPLLVTFTKTITSAYANFLDYAPDVPIVDLCAWDTPPEVIPAKMDAWAMGSLTFYEDDQEYIEYATIHHDEVHVAPVPVQQKKIVVSPIKKIMRGVGGKKVSEKETAADTLVAALKLPLKQPILKPILSKKSVSVL